MALEKIQRLLESCYSLHEADAISRWIFDDDKPMEDLDYLQYHIRVCSEEDDSFVGKVSLKRIENY